MYTSKGYNFFGDGRASFANWYGCVPMFMDGYWDNYYDPRYSYEPVRWMNNGFGAIRSAANDRANSNPHSGGMNVIFLDGHVENCKYVPGKPNSSHSLFRGSILMGSGGRGLEQLGLVMPIGGGRAARRPATGRSAARAGSEGGVIGSTQSWDRLRAYPNELT